MKLDVVGDAALVVANLDARRSDILVTTTPSTTLCGVVFACLVCVQHHIVELGNAALEESQKVSVTEGGQGATRAGIGRAVSAEHRGHIEGR